MIINSVNLENLSLVQIAELYNLIAAKPVKKFESKAKGLDRLRAALEETRHEVIFSDGEYDVRPLADATVALTDLEYGMMDTIAHAEHNTTNGATPTAASDVHTWLWADEFAAALGINAQAAGGVLSSLEQKGAIGMDATQGKDSGVWFTELGFAAWKADHDAGRVYAKPSAVKPAAAPAQTTPRSSGKSKKTGGKRGPAPDYSDDMVIAGVVSNPKRPGSMAHTRFALYREGMTVGAFLKAGGRRDDLSWDVKHGHIKIGREGA